MTKKSNIGLQVFFLNTNQKYEDIFVFTSTLNSNSNIKLKLNETSLPMNKILSYMKLCTLLIYAVSKQVKNSAL